MKFDLYVKRFACMEIPKSATEPSEMSIRVRPEERRLRRTRNQKIVKTKPKCSIYLSTNFFDGGGQGAAKSIGSGDGGGGSGTAFNSFINFHFVVLLLLFSRIHNRTILIRQCFMCVI